MEHQRWRGCVVGMGAALGLLVGPAEAVRADQEGASRPGEDVGAVERGDPRRVPPKSAEPDEAIEDCGKERSGKDDASRTADAKRPEAHQVTFGIQFRGEVTSYRLMSTTALPNESIDVKVVLGAEGERFEARAEDGRLRQTGPRAWTWTAPKAPGVYCLEIEEATSKEKVCLQAFVMQPYRGQRKLEGYVIGQYPKRPLRGNPAYERPRGLIEVQPEDHDRWVSPHFQLRQFLCKQNDGPPKFMILSTRLLVKLEMILDEVRKKGIDADTFFVMSGYRTPYYNRKIGNTTRYSRHAYGDAADIFIDQDRNGRMDDLDGDGKITRADAKVLYDIVQELSETAWYAPYVGGLGLYGPKPHRGPFVHVDTRGHRSRW